MSDAYTTGQIKTNNMKQQSSTKVSQAKYYGSGDGALIIFPGMFRQSFEKVTSKFIIIYY